jgi:hypothetical protein
MVAVGFVFNVLGIYSIHWLFMTGGLTLLRERYVLVVRRQRTSDYLSLRQYFASDKNCNLEPLLIVG